MKKPAENIWNAPNILTILRIALIPVYIVFYGKGDYYGALSVFLAASLTDFLDGKIARKHHLVTNFGKLMDPLADKLMYITVLFSLTLSGMAHWIPVVFVIAKELLMLIGGAYLLKRGIVVQSQMIGKAAQWLFFAALCLSFFHNFFACWILPLDVILLWIAVIMALLALIFYAVKASKTAKAIK
jgi:CDP-diacylglycerol--glycerol-3-phosphate 3-phosphatidyltransferase